MLEFRQIYKHKLVDNRSLKKKNKISTWITMFDKENIEKECKDVVENDDKAKI